jgi:hypothetical protein
MDQLWHAARADRWRRSGGQIAEPIPLAAYLGGAGNPFRPNSATAERATSLVCGAFLVELTQLNPLFAALPGVVILRALEGRRSGHAGVAEMLAEEVERPRQGSSFTIDRLIELLSMAAIRSLMRIRRLSGVRSSARSESRRPNGGSRSNVLFRNAEVTRSEPSWELRAG